MLVAVIVEVFALASTVGFSLEMDVAGMVAISLLTSAEGFGLQLQVVEVNSYNTSYSVKFHCCTTFGCQENGILVSKKKPVSFINRWWCSILATGAVLTSSGCCCCVFWFVFMLLMLRK